MIFASSLDLVQQIRPSGRVKLRGILGMINQPVTGLTLETIQEMQKATDKDFRTLRDFVLSLSKPEVYDFSLHRFNEMSKVNFEISVDILRAFRSGDVEQVDLEQVARLLESSFDPSNSCLERIGTTSVRVLIAKRQIAKVSTGKIGPENALLRARWLRDNYLFDHQGSVSVRKRRSPRKGVVKKIALISDLKGMQLNFIVTYQGESGRPTTKRFSTIKLGFDAAFRAALRKAKEEAQELDLSMDNPYKPTVEEYRLFRKIVPDLPEPVACL